MSPCATNSSSSLGHSLAFCAWLPKHLHLSFPIPVPHQLYRQTEQLLSERRLWLPTQASLLYLCCLALTSTCWVSFPLVHRLGELLSSHSHPARTYLMPRDTTHGSLNYKAHNKYLIILILAEWKSMIRSHSGSSTVELINSVTLRPVCRGTTSERPCQSQQITCFASCELQSPAVL